MERSWKQTTILLVLGLVVFMTACTPTTALPASATPGSQANEIGSFWDLVEVLRAEGATVEPEGGVKQPFFEVTGNLFKVNGAEVQVYQFADESTRKSVSDTISEDGTKIGNNLPSWIEQPNFWANGNMIVLYVGQDSGVINFLSSVLGERIAGKSTASSGNLPAQAMLEAISRLSESLGVSVDEVKIISTEQVDWPDACFGLPGPDETCAEVITPGFKVVMEVNGQQYEFHTDQSGINIRQK